MTDGKIDSKQSFADSQGRTFDVVTFGETMIRLSAPGFNRLEDTQTLDLRIGGSESNTAVALARLGLRVAWWSKLPESPLGHRIENEIHRWGVDTSSVIWDDAPGARAGLYFLDFGIAPRGTEVYYDRAASSASRITAIEVEQSPIKQARLLHLSGITPALSPYCAKAIVRAIDLAKESGTLVSFDINYRTKLWSPTEARTTLSPLLSRIDLLMCPLGDAELIFEMSGSGPEIARAFREEYGVGAAVVTCGGDGAMACDDKGDWSASPYPLGQVIDRLGAGDAFNAGVLSGFLRGNIEDGLAYGSAMAALKHTMPGDLLLSSKHEIETARTRTAIGIRR